MVQDSQKDRKSFQKIREREEPFRYASMILGFELLGPGEIPKEQSGIQEIQRMQIQNQSSE